MFQIWNQIYSITIKVDYKQNKYDRSKHSEVIYDDCGGQTDPPGSSNSGATLSHRCQLGSVILPKII